MSWNLTVERGGTDSERCALESPATVGGARADLVYLPDAPAAALRLVPVPAGVVVEAAAPGARAGGKPLPPGSRRLLRPGERIELPGAALELERVIPDTRVAAAALLRDAAAGAPAIPGARLIVLTGPRAGACHVLGAGLTLGRSRAVDVRLPDPRASRFHARIRVEADGPSVEDLGSKNGVLVKGVRVDRRPRPIAPGDEIVLGETALALDDPWASRETDPPQGSCLPEAPRLRRRLPPHAAAAALLALCAAALALAAP